ncbi:odorant receptor 7a-like [Teleopsis dalmanni]|uniref:odorant receptor 7a-like n=1 Tax=Teleopsis dalmanni TaxID=139649 RepID=UPI0018CF87CE|nr:odorant receptor 7a-like [Teleopsis dalmanni]
MQLIKASDNGKPLESSFAFRYWWKTQRILGLLPNKSDHYWYYLYGIFMNIFCTLCLPITLLINLFFVNGLEELITNISMTVLLSMIIFKQLAILYNRNALFKANKYLKELDKRANPHKQDRQHILKGMRLSQLYHCFYLVYYFLGSTGLCITGLNLHQLIFSGWFPQLFQDPKYNFYLTFAYQGFSQYYLTIINGCSDCYLQCYLVVLIGHIRALSNRIERIGLNKSMNQNDNLKELVECITDHKHLLAYFDCITSAISQTMLVQFFVAIVVLCLNSFKLLYFSRSIAQFIVEPAQLIALVIEIFPCCYYMDQLQEEDYNLTLSIYSCKWYEQSLKFKKVLIIFMQHSQRLKTVKAGHITPVNLENFVAISMIGFKQLAFLYNRNALLYVNTYLKRLDKRVETHKQDRLHILRAVRISRLYHWFYVVYFVMGSTGLCVIGINSNELVFSGWIPQVFKEPKHNFYLTFAYQSFSQYFMTVINGLCDSYLQCYLVVLIGHIRALSNRIERIGLNKSMSQSDNMKELVGCIKDHKQMMAYLDYITPAISQTMLVQFFVAVVVLCLSALKLLYYSRSIMEFIVEPAHLLVLVIEIYPCCYYMDQLQEENYNLRLSIYSCKWYEQDQDFQKVQIIFMQNLQRPKTVKAGNLAPVNLENFVAVIKFTFSLYTLLTNMT